MKNFVIFLVGAAIGGVTGWLVTKRHYKMKIKSMFKENMESGDKLIKIEHDKDVENASVDECEQYISDFMTDIFDGREEDAIHFLADQLEKFGATVTDAYGENAGQYYEDVNPVEEYEETAEESGDIYRIEEVIYNTTHTGTDKDEDGPGETKTAYSKETIYFYEDDQTFVEPESSEVVEKWRQFFGDDILNWIEDHNWRKSNLYIRNDGYESDYEIVLKRGSYAAANGESENEEDYNAGDFADRHR